MAVSKSHILDEIKRTANANSGVALGWRRFFSETGIKQSDWSGVHWVRWNDALKEAGFGANDLVKPYEKSELLQVYADLALELGRLPVNGDMRIKARGGDFPSDKPFRRLGTKQELVQELLVFCRGQEAYEIVANWCEVYLARNGVQASLDSDSRDIENDFGFVYLMKSGRFFKIGRSNSTGRREYELAVQMPEALKMIHEIRTDDPAGIEAYWHNRFKEKRKNGEWFDLSPQDVAAFKRRKFM